MTIKITIIGKVPQMIIDKAMKIIDGVEYTKVKRMRNKMTSERVNQAYRILTHKNEKFICDHKAYDKMVRSINY